MAVTGYELQWDGNNPPTFETHQELDATTTTATSSPLVGGTTYNYKIATKNKYGVGTFSNALSVLAAEAPDAPAVPVVTQESIYIKIAWSAPNSNHESIDAYKVEIIDSTGAYVESSACYGNSSVVMSNLYCLIPMTSFWTSPFSLPQGTIVQAKVSAHNSRGWSNPSSINSAGA